MTMILRYILLLLGLACVGTSGFLYWENQQVEAQMQAISFSITESVLQSISTEAELTVLSIPTEADGGENVPSIPAIEVDGDPYLGVLSLPQLGLELPVSLTYSYEKLRETPCLYFGSPAQDNLIIAAHNYKAHFGTIDLLQIGDEILLLDAIGTLHTYTVTEMTTIDETDIDGLFAGDWDLTLFTCLYSDNTQRVVIRLDHITT